MEHRHFAISQNHIQVIINAILLNLMASSSLNQTLFGKMYFIAELQISRFPQSHFLNAVLILNIFLN